TSMTHLELEVDLLQFHNIDAANRKKYKELLKLGKDETPALGQKMKYVYVTSKEKEEGESLKNLTITELKQSIEQCLTNLNNPLKTAKYEEIKNTLKKPELIATLEELLGIHQPPN
uniref:Uncharacterized protein n=1 Tax=Clytia hemisphaerica TaxID=252671 RepID=A0A7M5WY23_9CNID